MGNVWEWTTDWYADQLLPATTDPKGPAFGEYRTLRRGTWGNPSRAARASFRVQGGLRGLFVRIGVRCVADLP